MSGPFLAFFVFLTPRARPKRPPSAPKGRQEFLRRLEELPWSPEGAPKEDPSVPKEHPRTPKERPRPAQDHPRSSLELHRNSQDLPERPRPPKEHPRVPKEHPRPPRSTQEFPRRPKKLPMNTQETPRSPQEPFRSSQELPRSIQEFHRSPQGANPKLPSSTQELQMRTLVRTSCVKDIQEAPESCKTAPRDSKRTTSDACAHADRCTCTHARFRELTFEPLGST